MLLCVVVCVVRISSSSCCKPVAMVVEATRGEKGRSQSTPNVTAVFSFSPSSPSGSTLFHKVRGSDLRGVLQRTWLRDHLESFVLPEEERYGFRGGKKHCSTNKRRVSGGRGGDEFVAVPARGSRVAPEGRSRPASGHVISVDFNVKDLLRQQLLQARRYGQRQARVCVQSQECISPSTVRLGLCFLFQFFSLLSYSCQVLLRD